MATRVLAGVRLAGGAKPAAGPRGCGCRFDVPGRSCNDQGSGNAGSPQSESQHGHKHGHYLS